MHKAAAARWCAVGLLAVVALGGCGGSDPESASTTGTTEATTPTPTTTPTTTTTKAPAKRSDRKRSKGKRRHRKASGSSSSDAPSADSGAVGVAGGGSTGGGSGSSRAKKSCTGSPPSKDRKLIFYGNSPAPQFKPVLDAFAKVHPEIKVSYSDVDDNVAFSKYRAEHAQGARTADVLMASSPTQWNNNLGVALCWKPTGLSNFPDYVEQYPGIFVASPDPAVALYSKAKLPENRVPGSMSQLKLYLRQYPALFKNKLVTYSIDNQYGYSAFWGYVKQNGWSTLDALGPATKPQPDGVAMVRRLASGAANFAFFESGLVRGNLTGTLAQLVGWKYMSDFTPLVPRGIAVTKGAGNPAGAKTFINWLFSRSGQNAMCAAGFTAFRRDVSCANSVASIQRTIGASHVFFIPFHGSIASDRQAFARRWHQEFP